jgi:hypothetical protein
LWIVVLKIIKNGDIDYGKSEFLRILLIYERRCDWVIIQSPI